jgi:hypothetical protein
MHSNRRNTLRYCALRAAPTRWGRRHRHTKPAANPLATKSGTGAARISRLIVLIVDFRDRQPPAAPHRHDAEREA